MAYFLGYSDYGSYKPIVLHDRNNKKIENKILDVVHFTNSFGCENDLRNYLIERNLIPYHHSELAYLIDKGPKGNKKYEPIKMGNVLYLMDSQTFLHLVVFVTIVVQINMMLISFVIYILFI